MENLKKKKLNDIKLSFLAFTTYFLAGVICLLLGSSLTQLTLKFQSPIEKVVIISSVYAFGRLSSVYFIGKLTEKVSLLKLLFIGAACIGSYIILLPFTPNLICAFILAFFGGVGIAVQDAVCPLIISIVYPDTYSSKIAGSQVFYGAGCFAISGLIGIAESLGLKYWTANLILGSLAVLILILIPFTRIDKKEAGESESVGVEPLYTRNYNLTFTLLCSISFFYVACTNTINNYTGAYFDGSGIKDPSILLTLYSVGGMIGELVSAQALKRIKEQHFVILNFFLCALCCGAVMINKNDLISHMLCFGIGFFSASLYGVVLALLTRVGYRNMGISSSCMGLFGGLGDMAAPIICGRIVSSMGIGYSYICITVLMLINLLVSVAVAGLIRKEN